MNDLKKMIDKQTTIPDLLLSAPHVRPILDKYGLQGCGGQLGPMETLEFFANAHDVPIDQLLHEIHAAIDDPGLIDQETPLPDSSPNEKQQEKIEDVIYQPFFKAGIAVVLSLGAVWGAYLLLKIGFLKSFTAVGIHEVNAHGHAQIFGWVGLFVMGFAYQAFPRFKHTSLAYPRLAYTTLFMMLAGIVGRSLGEPLGLAYPQVWSISIFASFLEIAAIVLFTWIIGITLKRSGKPLAFYDYFILSSLVWFVIQAIYETGLFIVTISVTSQEQLLGIISVWQAPLREIQIHGFALLMILGVSQRVFHHFYGLPAPNPTKSRYALIAINAAIIGEIIGFILMRTQSHAWAGLWYTSILLLASSVVYLVLDWKIYSSPKEHDRNLKFLRAAYIWLFISLAMLVLLPVYQFGLLPFFSPESEAAQMRFSHAYYGAIRHAITVGFISMMIMGVAAKVVPTLKGIDLHSLASLWIPFILINVGCSIRVAGQVLTDFSGVYFPIAGISGILEVTGLAVWGLHLLAVMSDRARIRKSSPQSVEPYTPYTSDSPIVETNLVGDVLHHHPELLDTFLVYGFKPLKNPLIRKTIAGKVTIESACRKMDVNPQSLVNALNATKNQLQSSQIKNTHLSQATS